MNLKWKSVSLTIAIITTNSLSSPRFQQPVAFVYSRVLFTRQYDEGQTILNAMPTKPNSEGRTGRRTGNNSSNYNGHRSSPASPTNGSTSTSGPAASPTSALGMIVDSQREFEINLGRAVDVLKADYPNLLTKNPDWKIYHQDLEVIDPTGVSLQGLNNYKRAFFFIHGVVKMFYCNEKSGLTSIRLGYDWARKCIRVSWNVELVPKIIYGGTRNTLHVDGISEYYVDQASGLILEHKVSHLLINDQSVRPANGIFNALAELSPVNDPRSIPVFSTSDQEVWKISPTTPENAWTQVRFQTWNPLSHLLQESSSSTSLFAKMTEQAISIPDDNLHSDDNGYVPYDRDALQRKNASRRKFGMPPLTPDEFVKIEEEIRVMDALNKKKAVFFAKQLATQSKKKEKDNFISKIFGGVLKNGCESNFDCERPQVCCDVGFKKICCSSGLGIVDGIPVEKYQRGILRVPVPNDNYDY